MPIMATQLLMPNEVVLSTFGGKLRYGMYHEQPGTITLTDLRIIFTGRVLTDDPHTGWWWADLDGAAIKKSLMSAEVALISDGNASEFVGAMTNVYVSGNKRNVQAVKQVADQFRMNARPEVHTDIDLSRGPDPRCSHCGGIPAGDMGTCRVCGRYIDWPTPLKPFTNALADPQSVLPDTFPNGKETGSANAVHSVSLFAVTAYVQKENDTLRTLTEWIDACRSRTPIPPENFADLPTLNGIGDPNGNQRLWQILRQFPSWLGPDGGPEREIFKATS